jgi:kynurenine formamidase
MWEISRYDARSPAWYWNGFETGEHTGTHFDASVHWVTGRDLPENSVDQINPGKFIGPACVIDVTAEAEMDADFLLTVDRVERWEAAHWRIPAGAWLLLRAGWSKRTDPARFINLREDGPHTPGFAKECSESGRAAEFCPPLKVVNGSGSPLRVIAINP